MVQLPAINTPQFDWARNKLDKRPQPVPPIHDPDVAARAIFSVVRRTPRELWLGMESIKAIVGSCLIPGLLDHMLARQCYPGQMSQEDESGDHGDNLCQPLSAELHRTRGRFVGRSRDSALALTSTQVSALSAVLALVGAMVLLWF